MASDSWQGCDFCSLYNAIPFGHRIVDLRSRESFAGCCIKTSRNIPLPPSVNDESAAKSAFEADMLRMVGSKLPGKSSSKIFLVCDFVWNDLSANPTYTQTIEYVYRLIASDPNTSTPQVFVLNGLLSDFCLKYPFYCNKRDTSDNDAKSVPKGDTFVKYPNEIITDRLFLGTGAQATDRQIVDTLGITHIVNVTAHIGTPFQASNAPNAPSDAKSDESQNVDKTDETDEKAAIATDSGARVEYLNIAIEDLNDDKNGEFFATFFEAAIGFIDAALEKEKSRVMVHCEMGVSRSGTIVILYVMHWKKCSLKEAYEYVLTRREIVSPNDCFLEQLVLYEKKLFGGKSTELEVKQMKQKRNEKGNKVANMHKALGQVFRGKEENNGLNLLKMRREKKSQKKKKKKVKQQTASTESESKYD